MPERDSYKPGTPSWVELGTSDIDAAVTFYGDLFGWTAGEPDEQGGGYRLALRDGKPVAGLPPRMPGEHPVAWPTYVATDAADGVAERVKSNGAQVVVEPMDVMELGRMTVFVAPAGARARAGG